MKSIVEVIKMFSIIESYNFISHANYIMDVLPSLGFSHSHLCIFKKIFFWETTQLNLNWKIQVMNVCYAPLQWRGHLVKPLSVSFPFSNLSLLQLNVINHFNYTQCLISPNIVQVQIRVASLSSSFSYVPS